MEDFPEEQLLELSLDEKTDFLKGLLDEILKDSAEKVMEALQVKISKDSLYFW